MTIFHDTPGSGPARDPVPSLTFYFLYVKAWPERGIRFDTALRMFFGDLDPSTAIDRLDLGGLPDGMTAYVVHTYTEQHGWVHTTHWFQGYIVASNFNVYYWPEKQLLVCNASQEVVAGLIHSANEKSNGAVALQFMDVRLNSAAKGMTGLHVVRLDMPKEDGAGRPVDRMTLKGRSVGDAPEADSFRASGAAESALQFFYYGGDWPGLPVAVSHEGSIRLSRHIGGNKRPFIMRELDTVRQIWLDHVEQHASPRAPKVRKASAHARVSAPLVIEGQEPLDEDLE